MKHEKGFSLVELLVVVIIIAIIAAIAIPNLLASRRAANEASAISSLRTIHSAQVTYFSSTGTNTVYAGDIGDLSAAGVDLIDDTLGTGTKSGYTFTVTAGAANSNLYCADAVPTGVTTGTRTFAVASAGVIYAWPGAGGDAACGAAGAFNPAGGTAIQ